MQFPSTDAVYLLHEARSRVIIASARAKVALAAVERRFERRLARRKQFYQPGRKRDSLIDAITPA